MGAQVVARAGVGPRGGMGRGQGLGPGQLGSDSTTDERLPALSVVAMIRVMLVLPPLMRIVPVPAPAITRRAL